MVLASLPAPAPAPAPRPSFPDLYVVGGEETEPAVSFTDPPALVHLGKDKRTRGQEDRRTGRSLILKDIEEEMCVLPNVSLSLS